MADRLSVAAGEGGAAEEDPAEAARERSRAGREVPTVRGALARGRVLGGRLLGGGVVGERALGGRVLRGRVFGGEVLGGKVLGGGVLGRGVLAAGRLGAVLGRRALLLGVLLALVFCVVELLPGDAATATSERGSSAAELARRRTLLGLDRPLADRFVAWMLALPGGDLGVSARGEPVVDLLRSSFPNTLLLGGIALSLTVVCSIALGSWAAMRPGGWTDRTIASTAVAVLALPEFVVAVVLVLAFSLWTGWLPAVTLTDETGSPSSWTMLVLPVLALSIPQIGWNTSIVRAALADAAKAPYVETAVVDGLAPRRILTHYLLPAALPAIATGMAVSTGMLLGGAVAVETIFNYPGVGTVLAGAVADRDTTVVAGVVALTGAAITGVFLLADAIRGLSSGDAR